MPFKKNSYKYGVITAIALVIMLNFFCGFFMTKEVQAAHLPSTAEAMLIEVEVNWEGIDEDNSDDIPESVEFTMIPDGIAFMATSVYLDETLDWRRQVEVHLGTKSVQFKGLERDGFDYRILGGIEEGYVIEYYLIGQVPDDEAELAETGIPTAQIVLEPAPSQTIIRKDADNLPFETKEGEVLSDEEIQERLLEQHLKEQGYILDKTPYYIGIAVCVALIIVVIIIRILLGRN